MADFRVAEHHRWRDARGRDPEAARRGAAGDLAGDGWMAMDLDGETDADAGAAGPGGAAVNLLQFPARLHDMMFRPLRGHRALFLSARFLLILIAVLLIMQGVTGAAHIRTETGEDRSVTNPATVQMYLAPGSTHRYPIDVATGVEGRISALFTNERGVVRLPAAADDGPAYGLHVGVQKSNAAMEVELLVAKPGGSYRNAPVLHEEGNLVVFDAGHFKEQGEYGLLVRSAQGIGPAKLAITIVEASVQRVGAERLSWLPLLSGAALATVLVGPYLPGAAAALSLAPATVSRHGSRAGRSALAGPIVVVDETGMGPGVRGGR